MHTVSTVFLEEIVTGAAPSAAHVFKDPPVVNWKVARRPISIDMNTFGISPRANTQVMSGTGTSAPPILIRIQNIGSPRRSIGPQKVRNAHPFKTSINQFSPEHGLPTPIFSKLIGRKIVPNKSADAYARKRMGFGSNSVVAKSLNFMDFELSPTNTSYKLKSAIVPTTI